EWVHHSSGGYAPSSAVKLHFLSGVRNELFLFHCKIHRTLTLLLLTPKLKPISRHLGGFFVFVTFSLLKKAGKTHNYLQC
ncbi:hypothetical protein AAAT94_01325, partial [Intestinimonas aquisgranensis]|nr:hypothetical protein [Intestinimonas aquisgranensis]